MKLIDHPTTASTQFRYDSQREKPLVGHHTTLPHSSGYMLVLLERFFEALGRGHATTRVEALGYRREDETH